MSRLSFKMRQRAKPTPPDAHGHAAVIIALIIWAVIMLISVEVWRG